jgi:hypothetical protein
MMAELTTRPTTGQPDPSKPCNGVCIMARETSDPNVHVATADDFRGVQELAPPDRPARRNARQQQQQPRTPTPTKPGHHRPRSEAMKLTGPNGAGARRYELSARDREQPTARATPELVAKYEQQRERRMERARARAARAGLRLA